MLAFLEANDWRSDRITRQACIDFGYALATKYGEAAAAVACEMYDLIAQTAAGMLPAAEPAATATYEETAKAVNGTMKTGNNEVIASSISRLVKMAGVDTTMHNAIRDHAEWAWIPSGDTCSFCITLASRGWQSASKAQLKGNHAEHIHANCDCTFAIRFNSNTDVEGYDPDKYKQMYDDANTDTRGKITRHRDKNGVLKDYKQSRTDAKINAMRREAYAENSEKINAQKRSAYAKRMERESSEAEEIKV